MRPYIRVLVVIALAAGVTACDEKLSSIAGPTPNLEPTFASVQANVFEMTDSAGRNACTNCHTNNGRTPAATLNLLHDVAYDQLVNRASVQRPGLLRVAPGNPDNSYLIHKITERGPGIVGVRMPQNGPPFLSEGQILIVRRWIELGAQRN
jgi:hypothetical protein